MYSPLCYLFFYSSAVIAECDTDVLIAVANVANVANAANAANATEVVNVAAKVAIDCNKRRISILL